MSTFLDSLPTPIQKMGENMVVNTPSALVSRILDGFPAAVWSNKDFKWLNPVSKNGGFEREIFVRLMNGLAEAIPDREERRTHIINEQIWSFCQTEGCELIVRRYCLGFAWGNLSKCSSLPGNVSHREFLDVKVNENGAVMVSKGEDGKEKYVKFDCIVGNPPYQKPNSGNGTNASALYPQFVRKAVELEPKYMSMVIPSPWMGGSGMGTASFLRDMLGYRKLTEIVSVKDSRTWFPDVQIPGGTMYFMMEASKKNAIVKINGIDTDLTDQEVIIVDPMGMAISQKMLSKYPATFHTNGHISSDVHGIVTNWTEWSDDPTNSYVCHTSGGSGSGEVTKLIDKCHTTKNIDTINKWKVCISKAYGADSTGNTFIAKPGSVITHTYLMVGVFDSESEAKNCESFIKTHLVQYLVSLLKVKHTSSKTFRFVPYLDFTRSYSNQDLYDMFGLTKEEIDHVEATTKNYIVFRDGKAKRGRKKAA